MKPLSESLHRQVEMYALAASAAGVGVLALAQAAEAEIIYTRTHVVILSIYNLDLNHDGITDFVLKPTAYSTTSGWVSSLVASAAKGNVLEGSQGYAAALKAGKAVGPHHLFQPRGLMARHWAPDWTNSSNRGPWVNVLNRYLGLKFKIKGETHYGWARLSVLPAQGTLTGYAYETIPNKPIIAGKEHGEDDSATLGRLALGRK